MAVADLMVAGKALATVGTVIVGAVIPETVLMRVAALTISVLPASGSDVAVLMMCNELPLGAAIPLHGWLGAEDELYWTAIVVIVVPQGTDTVLLEATAQDGADSAVPPDRVTPVPPDASAMMQAWAFALSSAYDEALIERLLALLSTRDRSSGAVVVTATRTAVLPSPDGEVVIDGAAAELASPLSATSLEIAEVAWVVDEVEL
jgi:hypothetical protein